MGWMLTVRSAKDQRKNAWLMAGRLYSKGRTRLYFLRAFVKYSNPTLPLPNPASSGVECSDHRCPTGRLLTTCCSALSAWRLREYLSASIYGLAHRRDQQRQVRDEELRSSARLLGLLHKDAIERTEGQRRPFSLPFCFFSSTQSTSRS